MAAPIPNPQPYPEIPDKLYFRIGEVSQLAGVKAYVLRYWETEFAGIGPKKSGSNHRLYRRKDVELILDIKHLLYEKRYTIEGARKLLLGEGRAAARAENRALAKPVQAASVVAAPVALAVGAGSSPASSGGAGAGLAASGISAVSGAGSNGAGSNGAVAQGAVAQGTVTQGTIAQGILAAGAAESSPLAAARPAGSAGTKAARGVPSGIQSAPIQSAPMQATAMQATMPNVMSPDAARALPEKVELVKAIRKELRSLFDLLAN